MEPIAVLLSQDQHFTCARCGRCCRRTTVAISQAEAEAYRQANVGRWFSDSNDPFEPIAGYPGLLQIRKGADGACGFLSASGLCRLHEELGVDRKPLSCRAFPFRFNPIDGDVVVTTSFACPTIIANEGAPLASQTRDLDTLWAAWKQAQPEPPARVEFAAGHALPPSMLPKLRSAVTRVLDVPDPDGTFDLRLSLRRMAVFLEDLSRRQVLRLSDDDFSQYFDVMSRHMLSPTNMPPARKASRLARLLFRGFLLTAASAQLHVDQAYRGRTGAIRVVLARLALHLHGLGAGAAGYDLAAARRVALDPQDDDIREIATHYLRSTLGAIGTGRRPIVDEIAMAAALLNAACVLARMRAARQQQPAVDAKTFTQGLLEAADMSQADDGRLARFLTTLAGGLDALYLFPAAI